MDPDDTPVQVIKGWPGHHSVNSARQTIWSHMGRTLSAEKVETLTLCSFAMFVLPVEPTVQLLALRNMTNIEPRSQFELRQKLHPCDASRFEKRCPDFKKRGLSPKNGEHAMFRLRDQLHLAAHQQETHRLHLCLHGTCQTADFLGIFVTSVSLISCCNGLVRQITMYGHLTCPKKLWHVSDKRIGTISNAENVCWLLQQCNI